MQSTARRLLSIEEFAKLPEPEDGSKQELVRGEVITMPPPSFLHGIVQLNIATILKVFVSQNKLGRVTVESGVITESMLGTLRGPDVAYWSYARLPADQTPEKYASVPADACIEVRSPGTTDERMTRKVSEDLASGVRLVWVVDPEERTATVYQKAGDGRVLWEDATITGEDVLPGFSCKVADFFA